ncbi:MAG: SMC-Scp complex subunit ScpB [Patescibacteria group bacterium]|nr:SMC-Scp complex subunit ScpB [Patescibacteria group bacterium]
MDKEQLSGAVEALLFIYGEEMSFKKISEVLEAGEKETQEAARHLKEKLETSGGLLLLLTGKGAQLATKPEFSEFTKKMVKEEMDSELSSASLETLALVAYLGPVSRAEIDYIRGVNSTFILRSLSVRGLVEKKADPKRPGSFAYEASMGFLKHVGFDTALKLPDYEKYRGLLKSLRENKETGEGESARN